MRFSHLCAVASITMVAAACGNTAETGSDPVGRLVDSLYDRMGPEERIAQLHGMYLSELLGPDGHIDTARCRELIPFGIGHFCQYASNTEMGPDELRDLVAEVQDWIMHNTPNGIPALFHDEVISGVAAAGATTYPQQIGLACSFNPELAAVKTEQTATAMRSIGGLLALSPMVDVCRTPSFNRLEESYGEDAYLSASMGTAFVSGLQKGDLKKGVAACSKHFLGYGGGGDAPEKELMEDILMPHEAIIRLAGSKVLMTGYHSVHGSKAVASAELQQKILREYLHFDGMTVSDYGSIDQIDATDDPMLQAVAAINAGNDVEFPHGVRYTLLPEALEKGLVSPETLERAVKNVLRLKARLGMFDETPFLYAEGHIEFDTPEERATAYELASESVVLLKNDGILPLSGRKSVALTGPNANTMWAMLGDYSYQGMAWFWHNFNPSPENPHIVTLLEGLEGRKPDGVTVNYTRGCNWTEVNETLISGDGDQRAQWLIELLDRSLETGEPADRAEAVRMASASDVVIAAVGENDLLCGENRDRGGLRLPGSQEAFVEELAATGTPVVLIVFGGRAQVLGDLVDKCAAVIQAWYPGEEGGNALADILYGRVSPSGKLSVSYPAEEICDPVCYNRSKERGARIQYPFGYGLSYTSFEYSDLRISGGVKTSSESFKVEFTVSNTGKMKADEIVQLYASPAAGQPVRVRQLQGFGRIPLEPGESRRVTFLVSPEQLGYYDDGQWSVDGGAYAIGVGSSSEDIRLRGELMLKGGRKTVPLRSVYFSKCLHKQL